MIDAACSALLVLERELPRLFNDVLDSGLFPGLSNADRQRYIEAIARVPTREGKLYLQCFSDQEPADGGPRRISRTELESVMENGWHVVSINPTRFVVREGTDLTFPDDGPGAWFCVAQRVSEQEDE